MEFKVQKLSHIFALVLLLLSFVFVFALPVLTFIMKVYFPQLIDNIDVSEVSAITSQLLMIAVFILVPFIWYFLVNKLGIKEILARIKLVSENIDKAFLWGLLAAILIFFLMFIIEAILIELGYEVQDLSNFPDLKAIFSWPTLFFLVTLQPIAEEIFFRGFLYEKIENYGGGLLAVFVTAFLFGIAHMSYGNTIPVILIMVMGTILGYVVYKTKNLYSAIIAHMVFNVTSLALAYLGYELLEQLALIL